MSENTNVLPIMKEAEALLQKTDTHKIGRVTVEAFSIDNGRDGLAFYGSYRIYEDGRMILDADFQGIVVSSAINFVRMIANAWGAVGNDRVWTSKRISVSVSGCMKEDMDYLAARMSSMAITLEDSRSISEALKTIRSKTIEILGLPLGKNLYTKPVGEYENTLRCFIDQLANKLKEGVYIVNKTNREKNIIELSMSSTIPMAMFVHGSVTGPTMMVDDHHYVPIDNLFNVTYIQNYMHANLNNKDENSGKEIFVFIDDVSYRFTASDVELYYTASIHVDNV